MGRVTKGRGSRGGLKREGRKEKGEKDESLLLLMLLVSEGNVRTGEEEPVVVVRSCSANL